MFNYKCTNIHMPYNELVIMAVPKLACSGRILYIKNKQTGVKIVGPGYHVQE
jgi:hypothetical protein